MTWVRVRVRGSALAKARLGVRVGFIELGLGLGHLEVEVAEIHPALIDEGRGMSLAVVAEPEAENGVGTSNRRNRRA